MPVKRFSWLLSNIHLNNNLYMPPRTDPMYDKLYKIRPLRTQLQTRFLECFLPSRDVAIDESMIIFKGRSSLKQYMPKKPIKRGYKLCLLADKSGYCLKFDICTGKKGDVVEAGLGRRVVLELCEGLENKGHHVYFDNFFTSPKLMEELQQKHLYACGTVNITRQFMPTFTPDKGLKRGDSDFSVSNKGLVAVKWKDKRSVHLLSNYHHHEEVLDVKRRKKDGTAEMIPCPRMLVDYNYETSVDNAEDRDNTYIAPDIKQDQENHDKDLNITDEEIASIIGEKLQLSSQIASEKSIEMSQEVSSTCVQSEVSKIIKSEESQTAEERKWSSFLQKPRNAKPKPPQKESEGPKAPPYRVIIKKQPKKSQEGPRKITDENEQENKSDIETKNEEKIIEAEANEIDTKNVDASNSPSPELDENQNQAIDEIEVNNNDEIEPKAQQICSDDEDKDEYLEDIPDGLKARRTSLSCDKRLSVNLEDQLAQVQRQLLALSQLPSAIQQTLNSVTQQLSEIVSAKQSQEQEITIQANATIEEEITEEYLDVTEEREERTLSVLEEESYELIEEETREEEEVKEEATEILMNESEDEQAIFEALERQVEEEERKKEEELEARRLEQERIQKKDKERRSSQPLTPLQRPIILPGGRKWCQPDDASKARRRPSVTDERIANTINTFSEVIVGRTMGINFLKFQPPPKNLDYLQRSEVYRIVHHIEPPPKGVIARDTKVLAEQDYYAETEENLPLQMEP